jgi:hypothetical protein
MPGSCEVRLRLVGAVVLPALVLAVGLISTPRWATAQIISPGKLSTAHEGLEGMGNCTQCHQLRSPGVDPNRCLQCHQVLAGRIERGQGYHGLLQETDCGACHKEHLGRDFNLVRMDPDTFSHASTGYELAGAHEQASCRACHTPELISDPALQEELAGTSGLSRTYLGLDRRCGSCHAEEDPHEGQFESRDCGACHGETEWVEAAAFDHAETAYPLEGAHRSVDCGGCHVSERSAGGDVLIRYTPVDASDCSSCHEDPHAGGMRGRCVTCHAPTGWDRVSSAAVEAGFDHGSTGFELMGGHARAGCRACHSPARASAPGVVLSFGAGARGQAYPVPAHETCAACHVDPHDGVFDDRGCDTCHGQEHFVPPDYDRAKHEMEARFELEGAHVVTPCSACHEAGEGEDRVLTFRFEDPDACAVCHSSDDPHEGTFGRQGCDLCHGSDVFQVTAFDHGLLEAAEWSGSCGSCHAPDDPHGDQFEGRDCGTCHTTEAYAIPDFDHGTTSFPLEGAHARVDCSSCHRAEPGPGGVAVVRYRPLDTDCRACHGGGGGGRFEA